MQSLVINGQDNVATANSYGTQWIVQGCYGGDISWSRTMAYTVKTWQSEAEKLMYAWK
jgi:hypothetical protein